MKAKDLVKKYLRTELLPLPFCSGCGNGMVINALCRAMEESGIAHKDFVYVSGIGCAAWIPNPYMKVDSIHTAHGRAIPTAIGIKLANPKLKVIVVAGDGDGAGIGGNHLIHAARTNADINVILVNNSIYGMTGGQVAPTTPFGSFTSTTPLKNSPHPFDLSKLMVAAGASYVARWTTYHMAQLMKSIKKAILKKGFCFVEILTQCPVYFGRYNELGSGVDMLKRFKSITSMAEKEGKIRIGEFIDIEKTTLDELVRPKK
jgi:2-oxoglutarate ferredoxin oxidoreductase subunit beta